MMTFLQMQTRVGELINQELTGDTKVVTLTEVKANLNIGYRQQVSAVVKSNLDYYLTLSKADLTANQATYSLPTLTRKLERLEIAYSSTSSYVKAIRIQRNAITDPNYTFSTAQPLYAMLANSFELFPTPSETVTDGLKLWRIKDVADMSGDSDTPDIPVGYDHIPILYAVSKAKYKLGLIDEANQAMNEFKTELEIMKKEIKPRNEDDNEYVIVRDNFVDIV